jgi:hypothetical protein
LNPTIEEWRHVKRCNLVEAKDLMEWHVKVDVHELWLESDAGRKTYASRSMAHMLADDWEF